MDCKKIDNLPKNLTHLTIGEKFNQVVNIFPKNLTYLLLDQQSYQNNLPNSITFLFTN